MIIIRKNYLEINYSVIEALSLSYMLIDWTFPTWLCEHSFVGNTYFVKMRELKEWAKNSLINEFVAWPA